MSENILIKIYAVSKMIQIKNDGYQGNLWFISHEVS